MADKLQRDIEREFRRDTRREWARRHRAGIAIVAMMLVAMCIGAAVTMFVDRPAPEEPAIPETPGVAATFDGVEIPEDDVSAYVAQYRAYAGYVADGDWATYMDGMSEEPEAVREDAIRALARRIAVKKQAEKAGVSASDEEIEKRVAEERDASGHADDWASYLTGTLMYGDEDDYRADVEMKILLDKLLEVDIPPAEPTETQMAIQAADGSKSYTGSRSYDVLFPVSEDADATLVANVLDNAQSFYEDAKGAKDADAIMEASAGTAVDRGWSCLDPKMGTEYATALSKLAPGELSEPFRDKDGWHVIWCAETFTKRPDTVTSLAEMPEEIYDVLRRDTLAQLMESKWLDYADGLVSAGELDVKPMPEGLPYDVDMSLSAYREGEGNEDEEKSQDGEDAAATDAGTNSTGEDGQD